MPLSPQSQVARSQGCLLTSKLYTPRLCLLLQVRSRYKSHGKSRAKEDTENGGASPDGDLAAWGIDRLIPIPPTLLPAMLVSRAPASRTIIAREPVVIDGPLAWSPAPAHRKLRVSTPCPVNCVLEKPETLRRPAAQSRHGPPGYRVSIKPRKHCGHHKEIHRCRPIDRQLQTEALYLAHSSSEHDYLSCGQPHDMRNLCQPTCQD